VIMDPIEHTIEVDTFRKEKDGFFASDPHSPLPEDQKSAFEGLSYFPVAPEFRFEVKVERLSGNQEIQIQTSTGEFQNYQRFVKFQVHIEGQEIELTIFENRNGFFLPFTDSLSGTDTYPAGRYIEPQVLSGGKFLIDFNMAYNPYCAYAEHWSCPLTPYENRLMVPIRAGEKIYQT
jgi:uncharacterized protein